MMTLLEALSCVCYPYPEHLDGDVADKMVVLKLKSEILNCDIEFNLNIYNRDYPGNSPGEIVFEFSDD